MKKRGVLLIENMISLVILIALLGGLFLSISSIKSIHSKYQHQDFKMQFIEFINMSKYYAVNGSITCTLRFEQDKISLVNNQNKVVDRLVFPKNIRMISFNGINNRTLTIQDNGLIYRGATFSYYFNNDKNQITISAVTGKVNYV